MPTNEKEERRGLFPGALEMMVLQTLRGRPLHGYAIAQHIQQTSDELLQIEEGTLYPALQRLLREGWVAAEWGVSRTNRRVRIYKITAAGRKQLQREMSSFERMLNGIARVMGPSET
jgi:PadR family transcriptional regulator PadR